MEQETELTILHGRVIEVLDWLGIPHEDEYPVEIDGEEFQLDCYLPGLHVCIEADGPSHGMRRRKDVARDNMLRSIGMPTLRLRWKLIESETREGLARVITHWASSFLGDVEERRAQARAKEPVQRVPREECTCPDDCLRHEDIGGL